MTCTRARLVRSADSRESRLLKVSAAGLLLGGALLGASVMDLTPGAPFGDCGCRFDSASVAATFDAALPGAARASLDKPAQSSLLLASAAEPPREALLQALPAAQYTEIAEAPVAAAAPGAPVAAAAAPAAAAAASPLPVAGEELRGADMAGAAPSGLSSMRPFDPGNAGVAGAAESAAPAAAQQEAAAAPAQAQREVMDAPELARQPEPELVPLTSRR